MSVIMQFLIITLSQNQLSILSNIVCYHVCFSNEYIDEVERWSSLNDSEQAEAEENYLSVYISQVTILSVCLFIIPACLSVCISKYVKLIALYLF